MTNPAAAFAGCNPGRTNDGKSYFTGWNSPTEPSETTDNTSNIYNYPSPYVYPGSGVFAWVMLNGPALNDYAQVGWVVDANGRHTFTEWNNAGEVGDNFTITAQSPGSTSWYQVYLPNNSGKNYYFGVNGVMIGQSGTLSWTGDYGEDDSEIHTLADQMPGGVTQPEDWTNAFIFWNDTQENFNGHGVDYDTSYFNDAIYSETHAEADDKDCNS